MLRAFGVDREVDGMTGVPIRSAFLIDEDGNVAEAWPKISPKDTPKKLLAALG